MKFLPRITTLFQRLMLGIIPLSLAGIILLGVSAFYVTKHHVINEIGKNIEIFSKGAAASVADFFSQRRNDLETLSQTSLIADYYNNADYGLNEEAEQYRRGLERYFLDFSRRAGIYLRIIYVDASGREICHVEGSRIIAPLLYSDRKVFTKTKALKKSEILRFPVSNEPGNGPKAVYSKPVFDIDGSFKGLIVMETDLKFLQRALEHLKVGNSGRIFVTDALNRTVLSDGDFDDFSDSDFDFSLSLPVKDSDFIVTVTACLKDFNEPLNIIQSFTLLFALVFCVIAALFAYFTIRGLTRPVKELVDATKRFTGGHLQERVRVSGDDEMGALGSSFNVMAERIMENTEEMESRITELLLLHNMSAEVVSNLNEDNICKVCLKAAVSGLGFDRGTIYLINKERTHLLGRNIHSPHQKDFTDDNIRERRIPLDGQDVLADVVRARKPIIIENPDKDPSVNKIFVAEVQTKSFCLVPIMTKQKVLGVIGVDNYYSGKKIMADHLTNLILFANFTALALENASLVTDVKLSQERYRAVLDNSPEAILGLDSSFRITVWNIGAQRLFGYPQEDIMGRSVSKLFDPLIFEIIMREVKAKNFFADLCVAGVDSKGLELEMDVIWAGSGASGDQKEWTVVIRDTSEQRKMQSQLIQAEKLSAVGQLISGVAHELNNPLSVILGYSEMFYKEGKGSVNVPLEDMALIYESSLRCGDIVNNLLTFVRESHNKKQTVSVTKVVDSAVTLMEYKLRKTDDIVIEKLFEEHIPAVMSDFRQMEQIVVNLIQNACDAIESQSGEKKIVINVYHRENFVFISVADNGPGISEQNLFHIFEPFFTTKPEGQGTGLGLSICRRIAKEHEGRLNCDSSPGAGAVFTLELPILKLPQEDFAGQIEDLCSIPFGKRILVVDDEQGVLKMIKKTLESEGQNVEISLSARDAIEKLKSGDYDAVICDVEMGPAKGFSVRETLFEMNSNIGFIFTTGNVLSSTLLARLKEARVPFLFKPFKRAELLSAVNKVV